MWVASHSNLGILLSGSLCESALLELSGMDCVFLAALRLRGQPDTVATMCSGLCSACSKSWREGHYRVAVLPTSSCTANVPQVGPWGHQSCRATAHSSFQTAHSVRPVYQLLPNLTRRGRCRLHHDIRIKCHNLKFSKSCSLQHLAHSGSDFLLLLLCNFVLP